MKKKVVTVVVLVGLLISCSGETSKEQNQEQENPYLGTWDFERDANGVMTVIDNNGSLIIEIDKGKKFVGVINEQGILVVDVEGHGVKAVIDNNGDLIMGGDTAKKIK